MAKTRANLATRMLQKLRVVGAGQPVDSEDQETADNAIDALFAYLETSSIYSVADEDDIDIAAFEWIALVGAGFISDDFPELAAIGEGKLVYAENKLRRLNASGPSYEVMKAEYF